MGFLQRVTRGRTNAESAPAPADSLPEPHPAADHDHEPPQVLLQSTVTDGAERDVQLTGTTTFSKKAMSSLASRHGIADGGYLEVDGVIQREADNPADPMAAAVHVEGERIGYLPGHLARDQQLTAGEARPVRVQIFTEALPQGLRAEAWVWLGEGRPRWTWSEEDRPPLSSQAKAQARQEQASEMVSEALAGGGERAMEFSAGTVNGVHYLQLVEPIKQLKREGRLDEALELCYAAIAGAEADPSGREPAPWYTEQAAVIHRKLGQRDEEIAVLERWLRLCPESHRDGSAIAGRLAKLVTG